jgi:hypothetical protein
MKYFHRFLLLLIPLFFFGCHKDFKFENFDYTTYNRLVGPDGGTINYYSNYNNDAKNEIAVTLEFPKGALDSLMVFNMYQFEDYEVATQMEDGFAKFGSKLLYFVPFYKSEGYHERGQFEINYHLSIKFNKPVSVTYYPLANYSDLSLKNWQEVELYNNFYKTTNRSYKVYRIKIPKLDQWGGDNNIFVHWTQQGYPNGYDRTDLSYIINGRWSSSDSWGTGEISMENWELVREYTLDTENDLVRFEIFDSDYIYVVARDIFISNIPLAISDYVLFNFNGQSIMRASFDEEYYKVYLSDFSVAVFDKYRNFLYKEQENLLYSFLPTPAQNYLKLFYPADAIKKISSKEDFWGLQYEVVLGGGKRVFFNVDGSFTKLSQYGYNPENLPSKVTDYLNENHPGQLITNVNYDSIASYNPDYVVYLNSNAKVFFYSGGFWSQTLYYKLDLKDLPPVIVNFFNQEFPNALISEISYIKGIESSEFKISFVDNKFFIFNETGDLIYAEFRNLDESELPQAIKTFIDNSNYGLIPITSITRYNYGGSITFEIYFADYSSIVLNADGTTTKKSEIEILRAYSKK